MGLLDGKVAIITGAGAGLGRSYAFALAKEGAKIVVNDIGCGLAGEGIDSTVADKVVEELKNMGYEAVASYDSVAERQGAQAIVKTAKDAFGAVDILINNAGILRDKSFLKMTDENWQAVVDVHLKGSFMLSQEAALVMKEQGRGGRIINVSSLAGLIGNFGQSNYGSAKAGIAGLTRVLAVELGRYDITVNAVAPVAVTRMTENLPHFQGMDKSILAPELANPMLLFLASDLSDHISGRIIGLEGNHYFVYKMVKTPGVKDSEGWSPEKILESWNKIEELN